ncbi:hypothetical protein R6Q59_030127 [Mikania micrantha]
MLLFLPYMACSHDQRRSPAPTSKYEHRLATTIPCSEFTGSQGKWEMENRLTPAMPPSSTDALSNDNQSDGTLTSDVAHNFREFEENSIQERPRNHGNLQLQGVEANEEVSISRIDRIDLDSNQLKDLMLAIWFLAFKCSFIYQNEGPPLAGKLLEPKKGWKRMRSYRGCQRLELSNGVGVTQRPESQSYSDA